MSRWRVARSGVRPIRIGQPTGLVSDSVMIELPSDEAMRDLSGKKSWSFASFGAAKVRQRQYSTPIERNIGKIAGNMSYFTPISLSSPFLDLYERDAPTT